MQYVGRSHDDVKATLDSKFAEVKRQIQVLNSCVQNIGMAPFVQQNNRPSRRDPSTDGLIDITEDSTYKYSLSKRPKDLNQLWREYQFGIAGRAPAKDFTPAQRGAVAKSIINVILFGNVLQN